MSNYCSYSIRILKTPYEDDIVSFYPLSLVMDPPEDVGRFLDTVGDDALETDGGTRHHVLLRLTVHRHARHCNVTYNTINLFTYVYTVRTLFFVWNLRHSLEPTLSKLYVCYSGRYS